MVIEDEDIIYEMQQYKRGQKKPRDYDGRGGSPLKQEEVLGNAKRREIYNFINKNSGYSQEELVAVFEIPKSTFQHHLWMLVKFGFIRQKREKNYVYYFPIKTK